MGLTTVQRDCAACDWSDDNDTVSGIAILDTTVIPEMRIAKCNFNVVQNSQPML